MPPLRQVALDHPSMDEGVDMKCPMMFGGTGVAEDEECKPDCMWLVKRYNSRKDKEIEACAVAVLARRGAPSRPRWRLANRLDGE